MAAKVSLGFARLSDMELDNFAQSVIDSLTGNATYPSPSVTPANLQTAKDDFTDKISAAQGGCDESISLCHKPSLFTTASRLMTVGGGTGRKLD